PTVSVAKTYDGKERPVRWRALPQTAFPYGWIDTGSLVRPTANACVYAQTFVRDNRKGPARGGRQISIWAGSAGAMRSLWNDEEVIGDQAYRDLDADRLAAKVTLRDGYNRLLVKVCGDEEAPLFSVRVAAADGGPDEHLEADADPAHASEVKRGPATTTKT